MQVAVNALNFRWDDLVRSRGLGVVSVTYNYARSVLWEVCGKSTWYKCKLCWLDPSVKSVYFVKISHWVQNLTLDFKTKLAYFFEGKKVCTK